MHDMFETYDYNFKKTSTRIAPYPGPNSISSGSIEWLMSATNKVLGISATHTEDFTIYFSFVINNENYKNIFTKLNDNTFICEFLDKAYEPVLEKEVISEYPGIFKVKVSANELDTGNYFLKISEKEASASSDHSDLGAINPDGTPTGVAAEPAISEQEGIVISQDSSFIVTIS